MNRCLPWHPTVPQSRIHFFRPRLPSNSLKWLGSATFGSPILLLFGNHFPTRRDMNQSIAGDNGSAALLGGSMPKNATARLTVVPGITGTIHISNIVLNSIVLGHFLKYRHLRTPFAIYLINLLSTNFACAWLQSPAKFIVGLYNSNWTVLNSAVCTVNLYGAGVVGAGTMTSHVLITINRLWALVFPLSYK